MAACSTCSPAGEASSGSPRSGREQAWGQRGSRARCRRECRSSARRSIRAWHRRPPSCSRRTQTSTCSRATGVRRSEGRPRRRARSRHAGRNDRRGRLLDRLERPGCAARAMARAPARGGDDARNGTRSLDARGGRPALAVVRPSGGKPRPRPAAAHEDREEAPADNGERRRGGKVRGRSRCHQACDGEGGRRGEDGPTRRPADPEQDGRQDRGPSDPDADEGRRRVTRLR